MPSWCDVVAGGARCAGRIAAAAGAVAGDGAHPGTAPPPWPQPPSTPADVDHSCTVEQQATLELAEVAAPTAQCPLQQQGLATQLPVRLEDALRREFASLSVGLVDAVAPAVRAVIMQTPPQQVGTPSRKGAALCCKPCRLVPRSPSEPGAHTNLALQAASSGAGVAAAVNEKELAERLQAGLARPLGAALQSAVERQLLPPLERAVGEAFRQVLAAIACLCVSMSRWLVGKALQAGAAT